MKCSFFGMSVIGGRVDYPTKLINVPAHYVVQVRVFVDAICMRAHRRRIACRRMNEPVFHAFLLKRYYREKQEQGFACCWLWTTLSNSR